MFITVAEERLSDTSLDYVVMKFIRWLLNEFTLLQLLNLIDQLSEDTNFNWGFDEIREYLESEFTGIKKQQVNALIAFLEQHHDIALLKLELNKIDKENN